MELILLGITNLLSDHPEKYTKVYSNHWGIVLARNNVAKFTLFQDSNEASGSQHNLVLDGEFIRLFRLFATSFPSQEVDFDMSRLALLSFG